MASSEEYYGQNLVFIVGCPRSGTTWLQRLLACHPKIRTGQETNLFSDYIGLLLNRFYYTLNPEFRGGVGMGCYLTEEEFLKILQSFMFTLLQPIVKHLNSGEFFVEKTPDHTKYVREIIMFLPQCRIINVVRDARDVVASLLAASKSWGRSWAPSTVDQAAQKWVDTIVAVRDAKKYVPLNQFFEVRYEDLYETPQKILTMCCDFLGLDWDEKAVSQAIEANNPKTVTFSNPGTPIPLGGEIARRSGSIVVEPKGFIRRACPGNWRSDLSLLEKYRVWRICRKIMAEVGYSWPFFLTS
jgi:hypothetical protein